jgi:hypothetical protein
MRYDDVNHVFSVMFVIMSLRVMTWDIELFISNNVDTFVKGRQIAHWQLIRDDVVIRCI